MPVKALRLREVDAKAGTVTSTLLGVCRYQADGALLGILRKRSDTGTPKLTLTPQRSCSVLSMF